MANAGPGPRSSKRPASQEVDEPKPKRVHAEKPKTPYVHEKPTPYIPTAVDSWAIKTGKELARVMHSLAFQSIFEVAHNDNWKMAVRFARRVGCRYIDTTRCYFTRSFPGRNLEALSWAYWIRGCGIVDRPELIHGMFDICYRTSRAVLVRCKLSDQISRPITEALFLANAHPMFAECCLTSQKARRQEITRGIPDDVPTDEDEEFGLEPTASSLSLAFRPEKGCRYLTQCLPDPDEEWDLEMACAPPVHKRVLTELLAEFRSRLPAQKRHKPYSVAIRLIRASTNTYETLNGTDGGDDTVLHTILRYYAPSSAPVDELCWLLSYLPILELDVFCFPRNKWVRSSDFLHEADPDVERKEIPRIRVLRDLIHTSYQIMSVIRHRRNLLVREVLVDTLPYELFALIDSYNAAPPPA